MSALDMMMSSALFLKLKSFIDYTESITPLYYLIGFSTMKRIPIVNYNFFIFSTSLVSTSRAMLTPFAF